MATRIPVSWLILLTILTVCGFFAYHIFQAAGDNGTVNASQTEAYPPYSPEESAPPAPNKKVHFATDDGYEMENGPALVSEKNPPIPNEMPYVPGQTDEDLRAPEPLQRTPPSQYYDAPDATDPLNRAVYMEAEFGSNFRHPEQMIEQHPKPGMGAAVESGLGAVVSSPGGNNAAGYSPEMIQNAGEFMQGVIAFDGSEMNSAYSLL